MFRRWLMRLLGGLIGGGLVALVWWLIATFGMIVVWILGSLVALGVGIWVTFLVYMLVQGVNAFEMLLTRFIEVNQDFYESQEKILKRQNDLSKKLNNDLGDIAVIRRHANNIELVVKSLSEMHRAIKDTTKNTKSATDELRVSRDIASNLADVSKNIRILDRIAGSLKKATEDLNGR